ncbi:MAG: ABC transporter substrate-binding protein [Anaerolinea sp.]|nr:ABC transporter substrate-binding protein [Anaerolinea sp.]
MTRSIRIGVLATLYGPFEHMGKDGLRGVELAVNEFGGAVAGCPIELYPMGTIGAPDVAEEAVQALIEETQVDFVVGPLSGNEGLAVRNYASLHQDHVFLNGSSGAQELTIHDMTPNFFNFSLNGVQVVAGVGRYAYNVLGYRKVVTLGEDYFYPYAQVGGFMLEYCRLGGKVLHKYWVPMGTYDFSEVIATIPSDADAIFVALGGMDAVSFLRQYEQVRNPKPLIGGGITTDQTVLSEGGATEYLLGMVGGGPTADDNPDPLWHQFVHAYQTQFDERCNFPSSFALQYYLNAKAGLVALESIGGDLSKGQAKFKQALSSLKLKGPCGLVSLDQHHGAIGSSFVTVVKKHSSGILYRSLLEVSENVTQTMGLPEKEYLALGRFDQNTPNF